MTKEFKAWFDATFPLSMFPEGEEREALEVYTWLSWMVATRNKDAEIITLQEKIGRLEKKISDYGWERDAQREQNEINASKEWR